MRKKINLPVVLQNAVLQGLEREAVRVNAKGVLSKNPHPKKLGSPLTHPQVTLDFAEAQIELVTPPIQSESVLTDFLKKLYAWTYRQTDGELLWPLSMPPKLPAHGQISLADFGSSADAEIKHVYRQGLRERYGGAVQTISGIHYNFSLSEKFWNAYAKEFGLEGSTPEFKDAQYFGLMRNVIRYAPVVTYLFGASPAADASFFSGHPKGLERLDATTYAGRYATSLRLSDFGYHNAKRSPVRISFNSLGEYLDGLYDAISTPSKLWSALGVYKRDRRIQLNTNILQLENEFYASVRPKQKTHTHPNQSVLCSLACSGVEYVELRSIDIDPFELSGIGKDELHFLKTFMLYCLFTKSPLFKNGEQAAFEKNNSLVALLGRKPKLRVTSGSQETDFKQWAGRVLSDMEEIADLLDRTHKTKEYSRVLEAQREKILDSEKTPSAVFIRDLKKLGMSYAAYGALLAKKNKLNQKNVSLSASYAAEQKKRADESVAEAEKREAYDAWILKGYEHLELSTQIVIRAALKRNIDVRVLDDGLNVIELSKGGKREIVKQATITRFDTYLSYEIMKDKYLTKLFLTRAGIRSPEGEKFTDRKEALDFYSAYGKKKLVVKPATTNFGTGVSVVEPDNKQAYERAVQRAFTHDDTVVVEEFIPGKEYRFLVINDEVVAVLNRDPANVVGDGVHTIRELVNLKNTDPKSYKLPEKYIRLGVIEREILAEEGFTPNSVPSHGRKVYLRNNSNVNDGGDPIDVADMGESYKKIAIEAAKSAGAFMCGVDMMIGNTKAAPTEKNYAIIELNWNPALYLHAYPIKGKARDVGGAVLAYLGF